MGNYLSETVLEVLTQTESEQKHSSSKTESPRISGVVVGTLSAIGKDGLPLVSFPSNPASKPLLAQTIIHIDKTDLGRKVALMFEQENPYKPILLGLIQKQMECPSSSQVTTGNAIKRQLIKVEIDGEEAVLTAQKQIVLRCGDASITLTRAGKILIKGTYVLSRSSGVNRIKGGSVQIN